MSTLDSLLEELVKRGHRGMRLGLDRTIAAAKALGDPHRGLAAVHIAGTNGKGSVAAMVERIARQAGRRTGLYTSPHLVRFSERIRIDGAPVADDVFAAALDRVLHDAPEELTFFETLTLAAFVIFREQAVDVAVLEVGLGGRLDATNIVERPLAAAIVSLTEGQDGKWLEHADYLGTDAATIAREKAGILKPDCPAVLGPLPAVLGNVVREVATTVSARPVWEVSAEPGASNDGYVIIDRAAGRARFPDGASVTLAPGLPGDHQLENAAVAAATARLAGGRLADVEIIEHGIAAAEWPGRLERFEHEGRELWLDCAHNLEGARALSRSIDRILAGRDATLLFGALSDKPWDPVLRLLAPRFTRRVYTSPPGRAAAPLEALVSIAQGEVVEAPRDALRRSLDVTPHGGVILATGSLYLVGQIRSAVCGVASDPAMGL